MITSSNRRQRVRLDNQFITIYLQLAKKWYAGEGPNENAQHDFNESEIKNIQGRHFAISDILQPYCRGSDWRKLEKVNERGLRAVFCDWRSPYDKLRTYKCTDG